MSARKRDASITYSTGDEKGFMRLFIAIELPKNVRQEAQRMLLELKKNSQRGRFVPVNNMHITLSFLGETNNLAGAAGAMQRAAEGIRAFSLHLGKYSCFDRGDEKTSHITVKGNLEELNTLYYSLTSALADEGFKTQGKRYVPHITLGRSVVHDDDVKNALLAIDPPLNASMTVNSIVLFESTREAGQMVYTPLHREKFLQ